MTKLTNEEMILKIAKQTAERLKEKGIEFDRSSAIILTAVTFIEEMLNEAGTPRWNLIVRKNDDGDILINKDSAHVWGYDHIVTFEAPKKDGNK